MNTRFSAKVWTVSVSHDIFLHLFFFFSLSLSLSLSLSGLKLAGDRSLISFFFFF